MARHPGPEIIAHRGASRERPENTLAAFRRARELGADAVELDVHLTADRVLVVHHDPTVDTMSGPRRIGEMTLGALAELRVRKEPIPTLEQVVRALPAPMRIYCELKGPGTAPDAVTLLAPRGEAAAVHSFDHRMVADARRLSPSLPRGVLEASYHIDPTASLTSVAARDLWENEALIDRALIDAVHRAGGRIIAWTVDDPARAAALAALGVDGLCTNDVAGVRAALAGATG